MNIDNHTKQEILSFYGIETDRLVRESERH